MEPAIVPPFRYDAQIPRDDWRLLRKADDYCVVVSRYGRHFLDRSAYERIKGLVGEFDLLVDGTTERPALHSRHWDVPRRGRHQPNVKYLEANEFWAFAEMISTRRAIRPARSFAAGEKEMSPRNANKLFQEAIGKVRKDWKYKIQVEKVFVVHRGRPAERTAYTFRPPDGFRYAILAPLLDNGIAPYDFGVGFAVRFPIYHSGLQTAAVAVEIRNQRATTETLGSFALLFSDGTVVPQTLIGGDEPMQVADDLWEVDGFSDSDCTPIALRPEDRWKQLRMFFRLPDKCFVDQTYARLKNSRAVLVAENAEGVPLALAVELKGRAPTVPNAASSAGPEANAAKA